MIKVLFIWVFMIIVQTYEFDWTHFQIKAIKSICLFTQASAFSIHDTVCTCVPNVYQNRMTVTWKGEKLKKSVCNEMRCGIEIHSSSKSKFKFLIKRTNKIWTIIKFILDIELSNPISLPFQSVRCHNMKESTTITVWRHIKRVQMWK